MKSLYHIKLTFYNGIHLLYSFVHKPIMAILPLTTHMPIMANVGNNIYRNVPQEVKDVLGDPTPILLLALAVLLIYTLLIKIHKTLKLPPGPFGLPIFGILLFIKKEFHLTLYDYSRRFGKIISLKMGIETIVVLSDYKLIKKAFQTRDFVARPKTPLQALLGGFGKSILKLRILSLSLLLNISCLVQRDIYGKTVTIAKLESFCMRLMIYNIFS